MPRICQFSRSDTSSSACAGAPPSRPSVSAVASRVLRLKAISVSPEMLLFSMRSGGLIVPGGRMPGYDQALRDFDRVIENEPEHAEHENVGEDERCEHLAVEDEKEIAK